MAMHGALTNDAQALGQALVDLPLDVQLSCAFKRGRWHHEFGVGCPLPWKPVISWG